MGPVRQSTDIHLHLEGEYPQTRADDEQIERMSQVNFSSLQFLQSLHSENFKTELRFIQKNEVTIQRWRRVRYCGPRCNVDPPIAAVVSG